MYVRHNFNDPEPLFVFQYRDTRTVHRGLPTSSCWSLAALESDTRQWVILCPVSSMHNLHPCNCLGTRTQQNDYSGEPYKPEDPIR